MKKKLILIFMLAFTFCTSVNAEEYYYKNSNGVNIGEKEYIFLVKLYNEYYPSIITQENYNYLLEHDIFNQEIIHIEQESSNVYDSLFYETNYKRLQVDYACSDICAFDADLTWKKKPAVKSYDLFGMTFENTTSPTGLSSYMFKNNSNIYFPTETRVDTDGASATHLLPSSFNSLGFDFSFYIANQGRVHISYQHASTAISLVNSRKYSFNCGGYGHVFLFQSSVNSYYDSMGGIDVRLS